MDREPYYENFGWYKSPFIKTTSMSVPTIERKSEYEKVREAIGGWDRIIVVTAPIGYGKTTFMNQIVQNKPPGIDYLVYFDAYEPVEEIMGRIIRVLPFWKRMFKANVDRTSFGGFFQRKLGGRKLLLMFDEAQDYDEELFKWLRILNDRVDNLFMIFFGLYGLEDKITAETSFRDRKSKTISLPQLSVGTLEEIVRKRMRWVGGEMKPFTDGGLKRLCESADGVPRKLMDSGQRVIEECAHADKIEISAIDVENILGKIEKPIDVKHVLEESEIKVEKPYRNFMDELSPTQQTIVRLLMSKESLSIAELGETLGKDIRSVGSLIRKLRGLNKEEVNRKSSVPYPVVVRSGKEKRLGRQQYVYTLSDSVRRLLAT